MNGSFKRNGRLLDDLLESLSARQGAEIGVCAPFVYLSDARERLLDSPVLLGAQNVSEQVEGAYTGEISAEMLADCGCTFALVGHSERRSLYGETSEIVYRKFRQLLSNGITPVVCVGETLEQREAGIAFDIVAEQLDAVLESCSVDDLAEAIIAYEPVWAIGTGKTASSEQAQEIHQFIRNKLAQKSPLVAEKVPVLYGGSVKADNAKELFSMPDIDGGLVGGASLDAESFLAIYNSLEVTG